MVIKLCCKQGWNGRGNGDLLYGVFGDWIVISCIQFLFHITFFPLSVPSMGILFWYLKVVNIVDSLGCVGGRFKVPTKHCSIMDSIFTFTAEHAVLLHDVWCTSN